MTVRHATPERPRTARHSRHATHATRRVLRGTAIAATALLAFGVGSAAATYARINGNVNQADIGSLVEDDPRPTKAANPDDPNAGKDVNILLLGSDQRDGENADIGGSFGGMRSDTTIVLHISADRSRVEAISIPRDSMVDVPSCTLSDGKKTNAYFGMFNSAFATGWDQGGDIASAVGCTWKTVEKNTGVHIDHSVVVDFAGFEKMVDALGGVPICIPNEMISKKAKLHLQPGNQTLNGTEALGFARARTGTGVGDGSDTNRIGRQQQLIAAMVQAILHKNVLTDVGDLLGLLGAATSSVTTDKGLSLTDMAGLAYTMRDIRGGNITFMTIPWGAYPADHNRVQWTAEAATVWDRLAKDKPLDGETTPTSKPSATSNATPGATSTSTPKATPKPTESKQAGREAFSLDDSTASCSA
ncbi:LCP family protein [Cellulomonas sp. PhB150]|uniref:LCP family protein n=1 Tax=Cellulomonas sp. PhB150 TaxID=2485188 RepID=UPI000F4A54B8|nr:LCP family protein [Cellulomonas sp. PhB150]ROS31234.1 LytR family transcriptional attenuator [Cellulomonas sp. PhB150]